MPKKQKRPEEDQTPNSLFDFITILPKGMKYLTVKEVAELTRTSESCIRKKCAKGDFPGATKRYGSWRIPGMIKESPWN